MCIYVLEYKMPNLIVGLQTAKSELYNLPYDLKISTATITCKLPGVLFNVLNIAYYFNDFDDIIIGKKYGSRVVNNLVNVKKIKTNKKKKREKKNFFNQVSLIFRSATLMGFDLDKIDKKEGQKSINVKLFINGSIQMTGCKHLDNIRKCLEILFKKLQCGKAIWSSNLTFVKKPFYVIIGTTSLNRNLPLEPIAITNEKMPIKKNKLIDENNLILKIKNPDKIDSSELSVTNVSNFQIRMINTNFNIGFQINRERLCQLLNENGFMDIVFDPIIHACVNIKYTIPILNKTVSIFVFESGSITIAGSNSFEQISKTYNFINKFILTNYSKLLSKKITPKILIKLAQNIK